MWNLINITGYLIRTKLLVMAGYNWILIDVTGYLNGLVVHETL